MGKTLFIADTHFDHSNIIAYENRPFKNTEEMEGILIENWNLATNKDDTIFVLGDFAFHPSKTLDRIVPKLRGNKVLIMGNHDSASTASYIRAGFKEVYRYPVIFENFWMLSHEPLYINANMPYANIFGHVHSNPAYADFSSQTMCVSVERKHMNYSPITFEKAFELIKSVQVGM